MFRSITAVVTLSALSILGIVSPLHAQLFETKAGQAFMIEAETGTVLFSKEPDTPFPPASLAKLMTLEVVFNALDSGRISLNDSFYVSEYAWRTGGAPSRTATMFAAVTSSVPLDALIQGIAVHSANDACIIIAEGVTGSEENFAQLMTERARAIGLETATFVNSTGLPAEGQQVTVREMTMLARHLWSEYPNRYRYFSQPEFEWNRILQRNRNPLLRMEIGVDGLAAGFAEGYGYAITLSAERDGRRLFASLGGLESEADRIEEARRMLDWGMRAFEKRQIFAAGETVGQAGVYGGAKSAVALRSDGPLEVFVPVAEPERLTARIVYDGPIQAPVDEGAEIGKLQILIDDTLSQETPLYAAEAVPLGNLRQRALGAVQELLVGWLR